MSNRVVLYSQPDCPGCANVRAFLLKKGIPFQERDISEDESSLLAFRELGLPATPVTVIGGRPVLGYNRRALETLLSALT